MTPHRLAVSLVGILALTTLLAACGDDSTGSSATATPASAQPTQQAPTTASQSSPVQTSGQTPAGASTAGSSQGLSGTWAGTWKRTSPAVAGQGDLTLTLQQQGNAVTGTITETASSCIISQPITGTVNGSNVSLNVSASGVTASFTATVSGSTMTGTYTVSCAAGNGTADWQASRK